MKKIFTIVLVAGVLTGCYDNFRTDHDHSTVAFSDADGGSGEEGVLSRTVVKGEGLELDFGVYLAGVLENNKERWVEFELDPSLLNGTSYELMPDNYYTLSNDSRFTIPSGSHIGTVTIDLDSTNFVNDPKAAEPVYAIPFRLTGTSEDSILATQATKILVVKYMSQYAGFYNQTGSFTTFDAGGTQINSGSIENVVEVTTVMLDTLSTLGMMNQIGADYHMKFSISAENTISSYTYIPNPDPPLPYGNVSQDSVAPNLALTTSYVSPWESLVAVNDGLPIPSYDPVNESGGSFTTPRYGNWNHFDLEWLQYDLGTASYSIDSTRVYWGTDGGGLQPPTEAYIAYWDADSETMVEYPTPMGTQLHQYNKLVFDPPILTNQLRLYMTGGGAAATSVIEWKAMGIVAPATPEQATIATVGSGDEGGTYDESSRTLSLNYRVDFANGNYTIVETKLVWRNRIRDGINEWRR